ncbi:Sec1-like protein [Cladochytrium replicatum]|nr:Sec1-like protein [Cladochytrium replicatum]
MASVKEGVRHRILVDMLRSVQPPGKWKVLVVHAEALKIMNSACRMSDILDENVTVVEDLMLRRQPYPTKEAIYFIGPANDAIQAIIDDFSKSKAIYGAAHIFCTATLPDRLFDKLKRSPASNYIKSLKELNVDFIAYESLMFSLETPLSMYTVYNAATPSHLEFELKSLASRLSSVMSTLGEFPYIRYHDPNAGSKGKPIVGKLADLVQSEIEHLRKLDPSFAKQKPGHQPATLLLVERSLDVMAPLLHELTYQASVQDLLPMENGKYRRQDAKDPKDELVLLDENDLFWTHTRHWHIAEVMDFLGNVVKKFIAENKAAKYERDGGGEDSNSRLQAMKDTMSALPQYQELKAKFSLHSALCQEVMAVFNRRQLDRITKVEQDLATGFNAGGRPLTKLITMDLNPIFEDRNIRYLDKVRLLMLYIISQQGIQDSERQRLFELVKLGIEESQAVTNLSMLGVRLSASMENKKVDKGRYSYGGGVKEPKEAKFDTARYTPVIKYVLEDQLKGVIPNDQFPWVRPPPSDYNGYGRATSTHTLNVSSSSQSLSAGPPPSLRNTKPSWATRKAGGTAATPGTASNNSSSTSLANGGAPAAPVNPAITLDGLLNTRSTLRNEELRENGPRVIVFFVGGVTYSELRVCAELMKEFKREVLIGSTHVANPKQFLDILKTLHKTNIPTKLINSPTPRMPGMAAVEVIAPPPAQPVRSPVGSPPGSTTSMNDSPKGSRDRVDRAGAEPTRPSKASRGEPVSSRDRVEAKPSSSGRDRERRDPPRDAPRDSHWERERGSDRDRGSERSDRDREYRRDYDDRGDRRREELAPPRESERYTDDRRDDRYRDDRRDDRYREDRRDDRYRDDRGYRGDRGDRYRGDRDRYSESGGYDDSGGLPPPSQGGTGRNGGYDDVDDRMRRMDLDSPRQGYRDVPPSGTPSSGGSAPGSAPASPAQPEKAKKGLNFWKKK